MAARGRGRCRCRGRSRNTRRCWKTPAEGCPATCNDPCFPPKSCLGRAKAHRAGAARSKLAARAGAELALEAGDFGLARGWRAPAEAAREAFDMRLCNGAWYRVDTDGPFSDACFIEQLFGPFLARRMGPGGIVPEDHARSALRRIHCGTCLEAGGGEGAVTLAGLSDAARAVLPRQDGPTFLDGGDPAGLQLLPCRAAGKLGLARGGGEPAPGPVPPAPRGAEPRLPDAGGLRPRGPALPRGSRHAPPCGVAAVLVRLIARCRDPGGPEPAGAGPAGGGLRHLAAQPGRPALCVEAGGPRPA